MRLAVTCRHYRHNWPIVMPAGPNVSGILVLRARAQIGPVMSKITGQTAWLLRRLRCKQIWTGYFCTSRKFMRRIARQPQNPQNRVTWALSNEYERQHG